MRRIAATFAALALALATGCGGDEEGEPIPAGDARELITVLDLIEGNVESGACGGAESKVRRDLQPKVDALPDTVDADLRSALEDSADRLLELIEDQCGEDEEPTDTETTPTDTAPPETQPTEEEPPPPTDTTPTETQPTETEPPPTETTPPPDEGEPPLPTPDEDGGAPAPGADGGARGTR
ncbi:MAG: hypothetical protein WD844_07530 [Thermoleophilaceae bacterium]